MSDFSRLYNSFEFETEGLDYQLKNVVATIGTEEYLRQYRDAGRFIEFCKQCNRYSACWACPPFDFDTTECLSKYTMACIIGTKITLDKALINKIADWERCTSATYRIVEEVRRDLDDRLLDLEEFYFDSRAFFAGACHICPQGTCTRITGQACRYPHKIRPSLESFGFDISKTSSQLLNIELKWSKKGKLPEYFVLVSGLFVVE
jgi:predicted metal-binding protein